MPFFYNYFCGANGRTVQVSHDAQTRLKTWQQVCQQAGIEPGETPLDSPVARLISGMPWTPRLKGLDKEDYGSKLDL